MRECYTCGKAALPAHGTSALCDDCSEAAKMRATAPPQEELCQGCGHRFFNDNERQAHVQGKHRYRAWRGHDAHA